MIRSGIAIVALGLLGLFGYFFIQNEGSGTNKEKAKQAAVQVGDTVRDKSVAGLVSVRLTSKFGIEATRFLHTHFDEGRAVVYGLVPADLTPEAVQAEAASVVGVRQVEVLVAPRPDYVAPLGGSGVDAPGVLDTDNAGLGG